MYNFHTSYVYSVVTRTPVGIMGEHVTLTLTHDPNLLQLGQRLWQTHIGIIVLL